MNLNELFELQRKLDEHIVKEKGLEGKCLLPKKILALQTELGELANEWRGFKFWSHDQEPRIERKIYKTCPSCDGEYVDSCWECGHSGQILDKCINPLLEEYVDCLHLILSIGLELNFSDIYIWKDKVTTVTNQFIECFGIIYNIYFQKRVTGEIPKAMYGHLFAYFIGLGEMLGFTWEQIERTYLERVKSIMKGN